MPRSPTPTMSSAVTTKATSSVRCTPAGNRATASTTGLSAELSRRLRKVADDYLAHVNRDRPEHLEVILAPSIAPTE